MGVQIYSKVKCKLWPNVQGLVFKCKAAFEAYRNGENIDQFAFDYFKK